MADTPEAIKKSQKLYLLIGAVLFVFTVVTVAVATVPALDIGRHGFDTADMILGRPELEPFHARFSIP